MTYKTISHIAMLIACCSFEGKLQTAETNPVQTFNSKFEPPDGSCLFFIGQDLAAIGGLDDYTDGYVDHFGTPAGISIYTGFSPGSSSFGYALKGNDGLKKIANWGAGDNCGQCYMDDENFKHCILSIGLSIVDHEKETASGKHDHLIKELGEWIKETKRPVFLRIGYEFDGWDWNHYNRKKYLQAWKHIHNMFSEMNITNVAFVWQSKGYGTDKYMLEKWYPGDELVDWCAYSHFNNPDKEMLAFARKHKKPVFIAEAAPILHNGITFANSRLSNPKIAEKAWEEWFVPFIRTLHEYSDVIKAFSFINNNWEAQAMWANNPVFSQADSRIQTNDFISSKWSQEMLNTRYLKPTDELWQILGFYSVQ